MYTYEYKQEKLLRDKGFACAVRIKRDKFVYTFVMGLMMDQHRKLVLFVILRRFNLIYKIYKQLYVKDIACGGNNSDRYMDQNDGKIGIDWPD